MFKTYTLRGREIPILFIISMSLITFLIQLNICVIWEAKLEWEIIYEFTEYDKRFFESTESVILSNKAWEVHFIGTYCL